jgi:hypothetical protein
MSPPSPAKGTVGFSPGGRADFSQITAATPTTNTSTPLSQAGFAVGDTKSQQVYHGATIFRSSLLVVSHDA